MLGSGGSLAQEQELQPLPSSALFLSCGGARVQFLQDDAPPATRYDLLRGSSNLGVCGMSYEGTENMEASSRSEYGVHGIAPLKASRTSSRLCQGATRVLSLSDPPRKEAYLASFYTVDTLFMAVRHDCSYALVARTRVERACWWAYQTPPETDGPPSDGDTRPGLRRIPAPVPQPKWHGGPAACSAWAA